MDWNEAVRRAREGNVPARNRIEKTEEEWATLLTSEQFRILRKKGTERAFSNEVCTSHSDGKYSCLGCGTPLFDSSLKYDSMSGWPSFTEPVADDAIDYIIDESLVSPRVEVTCSACDGHLGHVFPDGPEPTGLRYCINSESIRLVDYD